MSELDPRLVELAHAHGIATSFGDWRGGAAQASPSAVRAVLGALGVDASDPAAVEQSLDDARLARWRRMLPPYVVARAGRADTVAMHVPHGESAQIVVELDDDGGRRLLTQLMVWVDPCEVDGALIGEATFAIPDDLPLGYHTLHATSGERAARALLIVTPDRVELPDAREWGLTLQLYQVRSSQSWSIGDLHDLRDLAAWSAELGAGFLLVNPLHAAEPVAPMQPSPYFPSSRQFLNPIYLRIEDVPEVAALPRVVVEAAANRLRAGNETDDPIDRDAVWAAKRRVLEDAFATRRDSQRQATFSAFVEAGGEALTNFATWCALADRFGLPWRQWPARFLDPGSVEVADFRSEQRETIDFHCWLQWLCAEQLEEVQRFSKQAGMRIGIVHDLAVGVNPDGADAWSNASVLARGVSLGAPADMYNQQGQCWSLPTWRPDKLAATGFAPFRDLVRAALARGGGLRIDHVIGLFRQWWVPDGASAADGTYVRLDHEALVGIVLLEAHRFGSVLVGEDLGNVEPWVRDYLRARGVLGTSILWFEHGDDGRPRKPDEWRDACLATVTTHDLPPTAGYLTGRHVEIRAELGLLERAVDEERAADESDRVAWLEALVAQGLLDSHAVAAVTGGSDAGQPGGLAARIEPYVDRIVDALHAYVAQTPALLVGIYLPDAVGDRRPINQPGTIDEYPNWRVPMADAANRPVLIDELTGSARARRLAQVVAGKPVSVTVASADGG